MSDVTYLGTDPAIDARVIDVFDKIAKTIGDVGEDEPAADVVRRAVRLFVAERTISFQDALVALFGRAQTHRQRADVTRASKWLRMLGELAEDIDDNGGEG